MGWPEIQTLLSKSQAMQPFKTFLADIHAELPYWQADMRGPTAIIVSNEAEGASLESKALADELILIPMPGRSESLNAAVAAGILLFEVVRE